MKELPIGDGVERGKGERPQGRAMIRFTHIFYHHFLLFLRSVPKVVHHLKLARRYRYCYPYCLLSFIHGPFSLSSS